MCGRARTVLTVAGLLLLAAGCYLPQWVDTFVHTLAPRTEPCSLAFSPDGKTLAVGLSTYSGSLATTTGGVRLVDVATLRTKSEHKLGYAVTELIFSRDGKSLFTQGCVTFWNGSMPPITGPDAGWIDLGKPAAKRDRTATCVFSSDGQALAWQTQDKGVTVAVQPLDPGLDPTHAARIHVTDAATAARFHVNDLAIGALAIAGEHGPVAYADTGNRIHVIDLATKKEIACLTGHKQPIHTLLLTPDGKKVISAAGDYHDEPVELLVWDVLDRQIRNRLPAPEGAFNGFNGFRLSADGRYLAIVIRAVVTPATDLILWDIERGEKVRSLTNLAGGTPAAFALDARRLAVIRCNGEIEILDLATRSDTQKTPGDILETSLQVP